MTRQWWSPVAILTLLLLPLLFSTTVTGSVEPGAAMPGVEQLTSATFEAAVGKGRAALVEFYAPWCRHCSNMAGAYATLGAAYEQSSNAKDSLLIAKVDATAETALAKTYGVQGFPTILFFPAESTNPEPYNGGRSAIDFQKFLQSRVADLSLDTAAAAAAAVKDGAPPSAAEGKEDTVVELDRHAFAALTEDPAKAALVMFYAPWCGYCKAFQPIYREVAAVYENEDDIVIAKLDATDPQNQEIAKEFGIRSFPTIFFFPKGVAAAKRQQYSGERSKLKLVAYINEKAGAYRLADGDLSWAYGVSAELTKGVGKMARGGKVPATELLAEVLQMVEKRPANASTRYYAEVAQRIASDGASFIGEELQRLDRALGGTVAGRERDAMLLQINILSALRGYS